MLHRGKLFVAFARSLRAVSACPIACWRCAAAFCPNERLTEGLRKASDEACSAGRVPRKRPGEYSLFLFAIVVLLGDSASGQLDLQDFAPLESNAQSGAFLIVHKAELCFFTPMT